MAKVAKNNHHKCFACKEKEGLRVCPHCNELFCKKHFAPRPVGMPRYHDSSPLAQKFMDEFHKEGGHPDFAYTEVWLKNINKEDEAYGEALKKLLSKKNKKYASYNDYSYFDKLSNFNEELKDIPTSEPLKYHNNVNKSKRHVSKESDSSLGLFFFIMVIIILFVLFEVYSNPSSDGSDSSQFSNLASPVSNEQSDMYSFTNNLHWRKMPLYYYIDNQSYDNSTISLRLKQIKDATNRLNNIVPEIQFIETNDVSQADIAFHLMISKELMMSSKGEGDGNTGGLEIHDFIDSIITHSDIYIDPLGRDKKCPSSDLVLHELLHAFGLNHDADFGDSLMVANVYEGDCTTKQLKTAQINYLKHTYEQNYQDIYSNSFNSSLIIK